MNSVKCMAILLACLGSFYSVSAMDAEQKKPSEDYVSHNDLVRFIREGEAFTVEKKPQEALEFFETAYAQAQTRRWVYGEKDGKLLLVLHGNFEPDQTDVYDVEVWKLLLDKVDFLCKRADGPLKERATLLYALTARKLSSKCCGSLSLAEDIEVAWQAQALERSFTMSRAEELAEELALAQEQGFGKETMEQLEAPKKAEMEGIVRMRERMQQRIKEIAESKKSMEIDE